MRETQKGGCERAADQIRLEKKKDKRNRAASRGNAEREERKEREELEERKSGKNGRETQMGGCERRRKRADVRGRERKRDYWESWCKRVSQIWGVRRR